MNKILNQKKLMMNNFFKILAWIYFVQSSTFKSDRKMDVRGQKGKKF